MKEKKCNLCPNRCDVEREKVLGKCKTGNNIKVALVSKHMYEEPCISGENGSGTIFFSGCNLNCIYCQNYKISSQNYGKGITVERLADIMMEEQESGAYNINLVTPTIYLDLIKEAITIAKNKGLVLPIIYNCGGYELLDSIKSLDGYIDIYMPDFKYSDDKLGLEYSGIKDYSIYCISAIKEMIRQCPNNTYDEKGMLKKGVIIRHMILPNHIENTCKVLDLIKENFGANVMVSIMAQYFPTHLAKQNEKLNRKITKRELEKVENYLFDLGFENGYIQELENNEEGYLPNFDCSNV